MAPVYDSGTSLWYNKPRVSFRVECKPFRKTHEEQIKLVDDLTWFDLAALTGLEEEIETIFSKSEEVESPRREVIAKAVMERAAQVERMSELLATP